MPNRSRLSALADARAGATIRPMMGADYEFFDAASVRTFRAFAACVVPAEGDLPGADAEHCVRLADMSLAARPERDRTLLRTFLRALEWLAVLRYGRRFSNLDLERRTAFLTALETNRRVDKLRAGVFGVKTYALLGYYGHEQSFGEIGYPGPRQDAPYYELRTKPGGQPMTTRLEYDVVIVGSGAGGGTVAERLSHLCESGARIALLEAGPHYTREHFNMREPDMVGLFIDRGAMPSSNFEIAVTAASCVGGSTAVYTGVTFRAPDGLIDGWSRDFGLPELSGADIEARFPRLEAEIDADFPGSEYENDNNRLFREGCEKLGYPVKQFRVNIQQCERCGFCNLGCPYGAKRGTLEVQVPRAVERGVELIPNCRVLSVDDDGVDAVLTDAPEGTRASAHSTGAVRIDAKVVVLAAGTLNTPAILQQSELPDLSPAIGRYLTLHPALTSFGRMPAPVRGYEGFPKLHYTDQFSESHHYYVETAFYFPFVTAKSLPGFGPDLRRIMASYDHLTCALTLVHDEPEHHNRLALRGKGAEARPSLEYRLSRQSREAILHSLASVGRIFFAAGAEEYVSPIAARFSARNEAEIPHVVTADAFQSGRVVISSAHPMGGCRMGIDPETSVTNGWGELHGHDRIVVVDASTFPTSSKVNPYLTIMALADRASERIASRL